MNAVERQGKRLKWEQKPPWLVWLLETMEGFLSAKWWKHTVAAVVLLGEIDVALTCVIQPQNFCSSLAVCVCVCVSNVVVFIGAVGVF